MWGNWKLFPVLVKLLFFKYYSAILVALGEALKKFTVLCTKQKFWCQNEVLCLLLSWLENCSITLWNVKNFLLWWDEPSQQLSSHLVTCFLFPPPHPPLPLWKGTSKKYLRIKMKAVYYKEKTQQAMQRQSLSTSHQQTNLPQVTWGNKSPPGNTLIVLLGLDTVEQQTSWCLQDGGDSGFPTSKIVRTDRNFILKYEMPMGMECFRVSK